LTLLLPLSSLFRKLKNYHSSSMAPKKQAGKEVATSAAEVEARLAQAMGFNEAELRSQALAQAVDDRRTRLAFLGERLKSYNVRL